MTSTSNNAKQALQEKIVYLTIYTLFVLIAFIGFVSQEGKKLQIFLLSTCLLTASILGVIHYIRNAPESVVQTVAHSEDETPQYAPTPAYYPRVIGGISVGQWHFSHVYYIADPNLLFEAAGLWKKGEMLDPNVTAKDIMDGLTRAFNRVDDEVSPPYLRQFASCKDDACREQVAIAFQHRLRAALLQ